MVMMMCVCVYVCMCVCVYVCMCVCGCQAWAIRASIVRGARRVAGASDPMWPELYVPPRRGGGDQRHQGYQGYQGYRRVIIYSYIYIYKYIHHNIYENIPNNREIYWYLYTTAQGWLMMTLGLVYHLVAKKHIEHIAFLEIDSWYLSLSFLRKKTPWNLILTHKNITLFFKIVLKKCDSIRLTLFFVEFVCVCFL